VRIPAVAVSVTALALVVVGCGGSVATTDTASPSQSSPSPPPALTAQVPAQTPLPSPTTPELRAITEQTYPYVGPTGSSQAHYGVCDSEPTGTTTIDLSACPFTVTLKQRITAVWPLGYGKAPRSTSILCSCNEFPIGQLISVNPVGTPIPSGASAVVVVTDPAALIGSQTQTLTIQEAEDGTLLVSDIHIRVAGSDSVGCTDLLLGTPPYLTVPC
jgi:hypothetical protein